MEAVTILKTHDDVHITDTIQNLPVDGTIAVNLLVEGQDATVKSNVFYVLDDLPDAGYDENSAVYANVEAMFDVDDFQGPVQVLAYPNEEVPDITGATATPTGDGATVTAKMVPGVVRALEDHALDGAYWNVLVTDDADTIKAAADFLYANQKGLLVTQLSKIADLQALSVYATSTYTEKNKLGILINTITKNTDNHIAAQAAAYASMNLLLDWMHIGNLTQFVQDDWTPAEIDQIIAANGLTVLNKSGDLMLSSSKTANGNFIDNSFIKQYNHDELLKATQKWMNGKKYVNYSDDDIQELLTTIKTELTVLGSQGLIAKKLDGDPDCDATAPNRADVSNVDVTARRLRNVKTKYSLPNAIETIYINNTVTL
ncbi:hypothetical protein [Lactobacillus brevis] [Lactiplantibacillus mudanjiangensis]|uniref:hypothetical protein n=1 Tax=Lactiplantibacillus mudanjiangensis TaxID=1296538 RepID=UPI001015A069|nr:hypothetical protein [Lactobacillus brevis] [Lactiplantibacillus mudanjiangensis]